MKDIFVKAHHLLSKVRFNVTTAAFFLNLAGYCSFLAGLPAIRFLLFWDIDLHTYKRQAMPDEVKPSRHKTLSKIAMTGWLAC